MRRSRANAFKYLLVILALILVNILIFRTFLLAKETKEKEEWAQEQVRQLLKPKEKEEKRSKAHQIPTPPQPGLNDFVSLMSSRVKVVQDLCGEMRERPTEPFSHNFENLFFLKERSLVWCPVFKAASTVWMQNFFQLADITKSKRKELTLSHHNPVDNTKAVISPILNAKQYKDIVDGYKDLKRFIVVRHPFHRLVSAFRDKIERLHSKKYQNDYYYNLHGSKIVRSYRKRALKIYGEKAFDEEHNYGAILPTKKNERVPELPIFWEFVQYVLDTPPREDMDEHWAPQYKFCSVCLFGYDAIVRFEALEEEEPELEGFLGLRGRVERRGRLNANKNDQGLAQEEITEKYFETLSDEDVQRIFDVYKMDFRMFGYEFELRGKVYK